MTRVSIREKTSQEIAARNYSFTVVYEPVPATSDDLEGRNSGGRGDKRKAPGYRVTVPLLPGLITFGRTLAEAREMARDAVRCHIEGLQLDGERITDERN
jgi:predicted RNase H-like HicB family nuclease